MILRFIVYFFVICCTLIANVEVIDDVDLERDWTPPDTFLTELPFPVRSYITEGEHLKSMENMLEGVQELMREQLAFNEEYKYVVPVRKGCCGKKVNKAFIIQTFGEGAIPDSIYCMFDGDTVGFYPKEEDAE